jgi:hypothetical protein
MDAQPLDGNGDDIPGAKHDEDGNSSDEYDENNQPRTTTFTTMLEDLLELASLEEWYPALRAEGFSLREFVKLRNRHGDVRTDVLRKIGFPVDDPVQMLVLKENIEMAFVTHFTGEDHAGKATDHAHTFTQTDAAACLSNMHQTLASFNTVELTSLFAAFSASGEDPSTSVYLRGGHVVKPEDALFAVKRVEQSVDDLVERMEQYRKKVLESQHSEFFVEHSDLFPSANGSVLKRCVSFICLASVAGIAACVYSRMR